MRNRFFNFLLFTIIFYSCGNDATTDFSVIETDSIFDFHTIESTEAMIYASGGDVWNTSDLATSEDGISWDTRMFTQKSMFDLTLIDGLIYAVGVDGLIYYGTTEFTKIRNGFWDMLKGIAKTGSGFVTVGGKDWNKGWVCQLDANFGADTFYYYEHEITDIDCRGDNCIASGYGIILYSSNGGKTWNRSIQAGDFFTSVAFYDDESAILVGLGGSILKTSNHGIDWTSVHDGHLPINRDHEHRKIKVFNDFTVIVGNDGLISISEDYGDSWDTIELDTDLDLYDVTYFQGSLYMASESGKVVVYAY